MAGEESRMTTQPSPGEQSEQGKSKRDKQQLVVVELDKARSREQVRRLRKGRGKLVRDIDEVVDHLVESGAISADTQPVIIVVRETMPSLLSALDYYEDEDEDDDDDDDDNDD
jgi:hypothetical protein